MKASKDAVKAAKRIFQLCLVDGRLDEQKVLTAVRKIGERKPRGYRGILQTLQRLVRLDVESRTVTVESAVELDAASRQRIEDSLVAKYGAGLAFNYSINAELLGGTRIRVGNDVWDGSVQSRLNRLVNSI
ncbi:F0F1 ATP synthase subunit delta [Persicirhabdus sediminis]|uniref:F0F1 ATP synthase subunit delta n=1 Tax=Persicirhabdus sediminis TaxID=454144 RepID=A0A8J7SMR3_9BACT|nr:F0F1 ATP synthase subunit delta [Persicirhabdus sediminis]MBK1792235.1 F0F1 ATP synthase subunit delta [Persicirhabdus sediminis]